MDSHIATYFSHFDEIQTAQNIRVEDSEMSDSDVRLSIPHKQGSWFLIPLVCDSSACRHTNTQQMLND